jgi:hypothetical protein
MPFSARGGFLAQPAGGGGTLWTPADSTATLIWLDATDSANITTVSGAVSDWADKNGSGNSYSQASASNRPTYDGANNLVSFDGVNDHLLSGTRFGLATASPVFGAFFVHEIGSVNLTTNKMWQLGGIGTATGKLSISGGTPGWSYRMNNGNEVFNSVDLNTLHLQSWTRPASGTYIDGDFYEDGTAQSTTGSGNPTGLLTNTDNETMLGAGHNGSYEPIDMDLHEFVLLDTDDTTERQLVEGYLAWRWGLEGNLPAGHPYKSAAPTV